MFTLTSPLILASSSPRRIELLKNLGIPFTSVTSYFEELNIDDLDSHVIENARGKVECVRTQFQQGIILGVDTTVFFQDRILGKPRDQNDAVQTFLSLLGSIHTVASGIFLYDVESGNHLQGVEKTDVEFYAWTKEEALAYLQHVPVLDKAGSYGIQDWGSMLVKKIIGDYYNVLGMPMGLIYQCLKKMGKIRLCTSS